MASLIDAIINPLKSAGETTQKLVNLRDTAKFGDAVIELQAQIMAAQQGALAAHQREAAMAEEIRNLKTRATELEAWDAEKQRYELAQLAPGTYAYLVNPEAQGTQPRHCICANCYENSKKSVLQFRKDRRGTAHITCPSCKTELQCWAEHQDFPINVITAGL